MGRQLARAQGPHPYEGTETCQDRHEFCCSLDTRIEWKVSDMETIREKRISAADFANDGSYVGGRTLNLRHVIL